MKLCIIDGTGHTETEVVDRVTDKEKEKTLKEACEIVEKAFAGGAKVLVGDSKADAGLSRVDDVNGFKTAVEEGEPEAFIIPQFMGG